MKRLGVQCSRFELGGVLGVVVKSGFLDRPFSEMCNTLGLCSTDMPRGRQCLRLGRVVEEIFISCPSDRVVKLYKDSILGPLSKVVPFVMLRMAKPPEWRGYVVAGNRNELV